MEPLPAPARLMPEESPVGKKIASRLVERETSFVFPSQAAADSWARAAAKMAGAVESDRFIGWDRFLEILTAPAIPAGAEKADRMARIFWALQILATQKKTPFLKTLLNPDLDNPLSRASELARLAPKLRRFDEILRADRNRNNNDYPTQASRDDLISDVTILEQSYGNFLAAHRLVETEHCIPVEPCGKTYILFEPSLMPGFSVAETAIRAMDSVEIYSPRADSRSINLFRYPDFRTELRHVFSECESLFAQGTRPEKIAISVPSLDPDFRAHIARAARERSIPIMFRGGDPLSASPFGAMLARLSNAQSEGFSLRTLKRLTGTGAFDWKDASGAKQLVSFAERYNIPEFSADPGRMSKVWKDTFELCGGRDFAARVFYQGLLKASRAVSSAREFVSLRRALHDFRDDFLDETLLPDSGKRTLERIFEELDELIACHDRLSQPPIHASPFAIFLLWLDTVRYVPDSRSEAVSIYTYDIGALSSSPCHFVLEASQEATRTFAARIAGTQGVPEALISRADDDSAVDTALLASLGALSGHFCHADRGFDGYSVPHPFFALANAEFIHVPAESIPPSPESREISAWASGDPSGIIARAEGVAREDGNDPALAERNISRAIARMARPPRRGGLAAAGLQRFAACSAAPNVKFTPARLAAITQCPFKWFMSCAGESMVKSGAAQLAEGTLSHALIRALLSRISPDTDISAIALDESYPRVLAALFEKCLDSVLRRDGPSLEPALRSAFKKIGDRMDRILEFEQEFRSEGWDIGEFEVPLSHCFEEYGILLEGRADRIAKKNSGDGEKIVYALIDYKKRKTPAKRDFLIDENGAIRDFQIVSYSEMMSGIGMPVSLALYWSIGDSKAIVVFGKGGVRESKSAFAAEEKAFRDALAGASNSLNRGGFLDILPSKTACDSCAARPSCRAHYSTERT